MKIVFMGTPDFAAGALQALIDAGHEITAVVTQPDKPKGRGKEIQMTPVKVVALQHDIPVFQPVRIKTEESVEVLRGYEADLFVVAAFGQILSSEILHMPKYGCINIHASLLPKYRGAAPIQWSIINGDAETGVTIMQMDEGMDTGDMLAKLVVPIEADETGDSLHDKLMEAGARLVVESIPKLERGELVAVKQEDALSCYASKLTKQMGSIDWSSQATSIERLVRGLNSWPSAYTSLRGKTLKVWEAAVVSSDSKAEPGTIVEVLKDRLIVACGAGCLAITSLQLEGKKRMEVKDFLLGYKLEEGEKLGEL